MTTESKIISNLHPLDNTFTLYMHRILNLISLLHHRITQTRILLCSDMSTEVDSTGTGEERSNSLARCTFCFPCCFGSRRSASVGFAWWESVRATSSWSESQSQLTGSTGDRWWARGFMKVREWSEIAAGPRWKTFIRRFSRNRSAGYRHVGKYQYDPLSYALNFDEGPGQNGDFEDDTYEGGFRNFSTRYAAAAAADSLKSVTTDAGHDVAVFA